MVVEPATYVVQFEHATSKPRRHIALVVIFGHLTYMGKGKMQKK